MTLVKVYKFTSLLSKDPNVNVRNISIALGGNRAFFPRGIYSDTTPSPTIMLYINTYIKKRKMCLIYTYILYIHFFITLQHVLNLHL